VWHTFVAKTEACDALYVAKLQLFRRVTRSLQPLCNKITSLWVLDTLFVAKTLGMWCAPCRKITTLPACDVLFAARMKAWDALYLSKLQLFGRVTCYLQPLCNTFKTLWVYDTLFVAKLKLFWRVTRSLQPLWNKMITVWECNTLFLAKKCGVWIWRR